MRRMQDDNIEFPGFDPLDDALSRPDRNLILSDVPPPDQDVTTIKQHVRQALLGIVHANRADGESLLLAEIVGNVPLAAGKGGDKKNLNADKSKPAYMLSSGNSLGKHGILLAAHATKINDYSIFKAGDTITYRMPKAPAGSRADIRALSRYSNGGWTVMLYRKLDTGNEDDVAFNSRKKYNFAMALFDDSGDEDSYDSEVLTLKFKR